jgi:uncharacterized protein (DUF983 family)
MFALRALFRELCPRCRQGRIFRSSLFRGWLDMYELCPVCGLRFQREQGYFLGAMYVSYAVSIPCVVLLILVIWRLTGWKMNRLMVAGILAYLPFVPAVTRFARVVWIWIDQYFDPEKLELHRTDR